MTDFVHPAVGMILRQLQELHSIITGIQTYDDHIPAGKLFDRWKRRTTELLRTSVNGEEATEFAEIFKDFSYGADPLEKLQNHAKECQGHLEALVVELGRHRETFSHGGAASIGNGLPDASIDSEGRVMARDIGDLLARGLELSDDLKSDKPLTFQVEYQDWYTRSQKVVRTLIPDRLKEFELHYQRDAGEELKLETYRISDYLLGFTLIQGNKPFSGKDVARTRMLQQIGILGSAQRLVEGRKGSMTVADESAKARKVLVVHGRDNRLRKGMFSYLRAIGLDPIEWGKAIALTQKASPYIGEVLDAAFKHAQAVVALLSPDDEAKLRSDLLASDDPPFEKVLTGQARPNVLFEAGMAFASHPDKTVLVQLGTVRPFSDIAGRHVVKMDNSVAKRQELALRLRTAGCSVDLDGTEWHTAGDFSSPGDVSSAKQESDNQAETSTSSLAAGKPTLREFKRITLCPVSRSTSEGQFTLVTVDELGVVIQLPGGTSVRVPKADYLESWDDEQARPKFVLTRKYFQGYFPGHEHAEEYFLSR